MNKQHTGNRDCCADCELAADIRDARQARFAGKGVQPKKRTWFISYSWSSYSVSMEERISGFGNVYHHDFRGINITRGDIADIETNMAIHHRPVGGHPKDECQIVVLNIVEIDPE